MPTSLPGVAVMRLQASDDFPHHRIVIYGSILFVFMLPILMMLFAAFLASDGSISEESLTSYLAALGAGV